MTWASWQADYSTELHKRAAGGDVVKIEPEIVDPSPRGNTHGLVVLHLRNGFQLKGYVNLWAEPQHEFWDRHHYTLTGETNVPIARWEDTPDDIFQSTSVT